MSIEKDKVERRYKRLRIALMRSPQFIALGPVMRLGKQRLVDSDIVAWTDGINETYSRKYVEVLEDAPLSFIIVHETMHKLARHTVTYLKLWEESPQLAGHACDYWINGKLDLVARSAPIISMPKITQALFDMYSPEMQAQMVAQGAVVGSDFGLLNHKYDGWTVKQIFDDLKKQSEGGEGEGEGGGGGGDGEGGSKGGTGFDEHGWEEAKQMPKEEQEKLRQEIERAVREGQMLAKKYGNGSTGAELGLNELLAPKVDWRGQLRQFVTSTCRKFETSTWRRPNRRFLHQSIIMPTMTSKSIKSLGVFVDASGSMFCGGAVTPFHRSMSEIEGLVRQLSISTLHLLYWDGEVCRHEQYTPSTINTWRNTTRPMGGGGTDPACITPYLRKHNIKLDAGVILTDGEVPGWGQWDFPTLWAICNSRAGIVAGVGKTIHIED